MITDVGGWSPNLLDVRADRTINLGRVCRLLCLLSVDWIILFELGQIWNAQAGVRCLNFFP